MSHFYLESDTHMLTHLSVAKYSASDIMQAPGLSPFRYWHQLGKSASGTQKIARYAQAILQADGSYEAHGVMQQHRQSSE